MSHVAAPKRRCCRIQQLPDLLRLCYLPDEIRRTKHQERRPCSDALFFPNLGEVARSGPLIDGQPRTLNTRQRGWHSRNEAAASKLASLSHRTLAFSKHI